MSKFPAEPGVYVATTVDGELMRASETGNLQNRQKRGKRFIANPAWDGNNILQSAGTVIETVGNRTITVTFIPMPNSTKKEREDMRDSLNKYSRWQKMKDTFGDRKTELKQNYMTMTPYYLREWVLAELAKYKRK